MSTAKRRASRAHTPERANMRRTTRLLVVDDVDDNREIYALTLEAAGYEVRRAASGVEALATSALLAPDLILMDLSMPDMDGWEAISRLRARPSTRQTPIIVLTGFSGGAEVRRALDVGASRVCVKPCLPAALLAEVERLLG